MKYLTTLVFLSILFIGCKQRNGTYIVYKNDAEPYYNDTLVHKLIKRYGDVKYELEFEDKYVKITNSDTKQSIVLAKDEDTQTNDKYITLRTEGADEVTVIYTLTVDAKNVILRIAANRKTYKSFYGTTEAAVDFYLSK